MGIQVQRKESVGCIQISASCHTELERDKLIKQFQTSESILGDVRLVSGVNKKYPFGFKCEVVPFEPGLQGSTKEINCTCGRWKYDSDEECWWCKFGDLK